MRDPKQWLGAEAVLSISRSSESIDFRTLKEVNIVEYAEIYKKVREWSNELEKRKSQQIC